MPKLFAETRIAAGQRYQDDNSEDDSKHRRGDGLCAELNDPIFNGTRMLL